MKNHKNSYEGNSKAFYAFWINHFFFFFYVHYMSLQSTLHPTFSFGGVWYICDKCDMTISNFKIFEKSIFPQHKGILSKKKKNTEREGLINHYHSPEASSPIFL